MVKFLGLFLSSFLFVSGKKPDMKIDDGKKSNQCTPFPDGQKSIEIQLNLEKVNNIGYLLMENIASRNWCWKLFKERIYGRINNFYSENFTDQDQINAARIFRALELIENSRSLSFEYANHVKSAWIDSFSGIESESPDACHDMKCAVDYFCPRVFNNVLDVTMYSVRKI